ncbi:MAG: hypothetical protein M1831_001380 [Alyxoria varia]|nr:MAG: hypothetical protein M1831_001380 [Alyxoria varia]
MSQPKDRRQQPSGIPPWQLPPSQQDQPNSSPHQAGPPVEEHSRDNEESLTSILDSSESSFGDSSTTRNQNILIDQAHRFLTNKHLRHAPLEEKMRFLKGKGLSEESIDIIRQSLSNSNNSGPERATASRPYHDDSSSPTQTLEQSSSPTLKPLQETSASQPPIITYPEHLFPTSKPATPQQPPLITPSALLRTLYTSASAAAITYATSRYLVSPMLHDLTSARHDFATHTRSKLDELNDRLTRNVSVDPRALPGKAQGPGSQEAEAYDDEIETRSEDSDPTELFRRDFGTQTSPALSRRGSRSRRKTSRRRDSRDSDSSSTSYKPDRDESKHPAADPTETQTQHLSQLRDLCKSLTSSTLPSETSTSPLTALSNSTKSLRDDLNTLALETKDSRESNPWGVSSSSSDQTHRNKKEQNETSGMRAEIRSVKGLMLSARNFPGSAAGNGPLDRAGGASLRARHFAPSEGDEGVAVNGES